VSAGVLGLKCRGQDLRLKLTVAPSREFYSRVTRFPKVLRARIVSNFKELQRFAGVQIPPSAPISCNRKGGRPAPFGPFNSWLHLSR